MGERAIVVCALEFERRLLVRAGVGRRCELTCCGPGAEGVRRWASGQSPSGAVFLCGLAGALSDRIAVGTACSVAVVVGDEQQTRPPITDSGGVIVSCPAHTLTTPAAKRAWAERHGADLVDLESAAFARIAVQEGWDWGIVRGVSDGPDFSLPADIDTWVDQQGRSRPGRVLRAILSGRVGVGQLARLRTQGIAAMAAAAVVLQRMLER
jgi:hypothetical protein